MLVEAVMGGTGKTADERELEVQLSMEQNVIDEWQLQSMYDEVHDVQDTCVG